MTRRKRQRRAARRERLWQSGPGRQSVSAYYDHIQSERQGYRTALAKMAEIAQEEHELNKNKPTFRQHMARGVQRALAQDDTPVAGDWTKNELGSTWKMFPHVPLSRDTLTAREAVDAVGRLPLGLDSSAEGPPEGLPRGLPEGLLVLSAGKGVEARPSDVAEPPGEREARAISQLALLDKSDESIGRTFLEPDGAVDSSQGVQLEHAGMMPGMLVIGRLPPRPESRGDVMGQLQ